MTLVFLLNSCGLAKHAEIKCGYVYLRDILIFIMMDASYINILQSHKCIFFSCAFYAQEPTVCKKVIPINF